MVCLQANLTVLLLIKVLNFLCWLPMECLLCDNNYNTFNPNFETFL